MIPNNFVEVRQDEWDPELLWIELELSNICNYKCWYCWPGYNDGSIKWPDYDLLVENISYLLDYYLKNTNKKKIAIHLLGGEATHWKKFVDLCKFFKENYNSCIVLTTNGTKKLDWWDDACLYLDNIIISIHHEFVDPYHICKVADALYEKDVYVETNVLLDPFKWDKCIRIVDQLKDSTYGWSINYREVTHDYSRQYTPEQDAILFGPSARPSDRLPKFKVPPLSNYHNTTVIDSTGGQHYFKYKDLLYRRMIQFKGWECNVGVDWLAIHANGEISGVCRNGLYEDGITYNLFDTNFKEVFAPKIVPTICMLENCWCIFEVNMPKRKIIPIKEIL